MGVAETKIYPINTGWLEADLGTYIFWKGPAGKKYWNPVYCQLRRYWHPKDSDRYWPARRRARHNIPTQVREMRLPASVRTP